MRATAAGGSVAGGATVAQDKILTPDYYVNPGYPGTPSTINYLEPNGILVDQDFLRAVEIDGQAFYVPNRAVVLRFDSTNWDSGYDVHLWAVDDERSEGDRVIQSSKIGDLVMKKLRQTDHVAYVRFASVYKTFRDVQEFVQTLRSEKNHLDRENP